MSLTTINKANDFIFALKGENGDNIVTEIRTNDGFVNATKLCQSAGKQWHDYWRLKKTQSFINELIDATGIPLGEVIDMCDSGSHKGNWVHPDVAVDLAAWCSPKFLVAVAKLVRRYMCGELTTTESIEVSKRFLGEKIKVVDFDKKQVLYIGEINVPDFTGAKVGWSDDLARREAEHKRDFGNFTLVKVFETVANRDVEKKVLAECKSTDVRKTQIINGKNQTELIVFSDNFKMKDLIAICQDIVETTVSPIIVEKDRKIQELENNIIIVQEKTKQMVEESEIERNQTKRMELLLELNRLKNDKSSIDAEAELEEKRKEIEERKKEIEVIRMQEEEKMKRIEKELEDLKRTMGVEVTDPNDEFVKFIEEKCEIGEDGRTDKDRYRITCKELYEHYLKYVRVPLESVEFKKVLKEKYNLSYKAANWHHETHQTWFGIRLKNYTTKKLTKIQQLILEFIDVKCILGSDYVEETKIFYDKFEEYANDKGFEVMKQNGFTRQLFRTELLKTVNTISIKEWAIGGKKHGFQGIKLNTSPVQLPEAVKNFVEECCIKSPGHRTKSTEIWKTFVEFTNNKYDIIYPKLKFFEEFKSQNEDLILKNITKSERGFVGIVLRKALLTQN
jgi:hypothetical protein